MKWLAALILLSTPVFALAKPMDFNEVVRRFVSLSPTIAGAEAMAQSAQDRLKEGRSAFWPELNLSGTFADQKSVFFISGNAFRSRQDIYTSKLELSQPIYLGGRVFNEYARRKEDAKKAKYQLAHTKNQSISAVLKSVALWISVRDKILVLRESQKTQKNFVEITRRKRKRGAALSFDLDQVEAEYLSYLPRIETLRQQLIGTEQKLAVDLGLDPVGQFDFVWPVKTALVRQNDVGPWFQRALKQRSDYLVATSGVEIAKRVKSVEMGEERPSLALSGEYGYLSRELSDHADSDNQYHTYAVTLSIPLFSGLSSVHKRRATQQLVVKADRDRRQLEIQIEAEVRQALIELKSAQKRLEQTRVWAEKANRALRLGLKSYQVGRVTIAQVVQLQSGRERAQLGLIDAELALQTADLNWQVAQGTNLQEYYTSGERR